MLGFCDFMVPTHDDMASKSSVMQQVSGVDDISISWFV
jgi:hypothetical protein